MVPTVCGQNRLSGWTKEHSYGPMNTLGWIQALLFLQLEGLNIVLAIAEVTGCPGHQVSCRGLSIFSIKG